MAYKLNRTIKKMNNLYNIKVGDTLDKTRLKVLLKDLQIAINRINTRGFYGR